MEGITLDGNEIINFNGYSCLDTFCLLFIQLYILTQAERSDVLAKPNPYKLLYAFEMQRHNWRMAASYMYIYTARLRTEPVPKDQQVVILALQERLNGLSAAINALHLVDPAYAWINPLVGGNSWHHPSKKAKKDQSNFFVLINTIMFVLHFTVACD